MLAVANQGRYKDEVPKKVLAFAWPLVAHTSPGCGIEQRYSRAGHFSTLLNQSWPLARSAHCLDGVS